METTTATWSNATTDATALEPSHAVHTPPRTAWTHDSSDRISSPEIDDTAISYEYHYHQSQQQQQQQPQPQQQGVCQFVHTQCEKELFTTEYLRYELACGLGSVTVQVASIQRVLTLLLLSISNGLCMSAEATRRAATRCVRLLPLRTARLRWMPRVSRHSRACALGTCDALA